MRILIYILAMLTGFSAAEAARPVSAVPASVDAAVGQAYASAAVAVATQTQVRPVAATPVAATPVAELPAGGAFSAIILTTPVLRHDVILG
jgi:hypothetical protein